MKTDRRSVSRRSGMEIMSALIVLVKPLIPVMAGAILLGVLGHLCAIFLTILGSEALLSGLAQIPALLFARIGETAKNPGALLVWMVVLAILRGLLHYAEQYCNHYIAFRLLAQIRHKVFAALRKLCPAKLEGRDKGDLIAVLTSDIELLEVFYAHTVSPIAIAAIVSLVMVIFIACQHPLAGLWALFFYALIGVGIPMWNSKRTAQTGMEYRTGFGDLNSYVLESLRGLDETIQYGNGEERKAELNARSIELAGYQKQQSEREGTQSAITTAAVLLGSFGMFFLMLSLYMMEWCDFSAVLVATAAMMGSFGPVLALSALSNTLAQTLASGERVLSLLEEKPMVREIRARSSKEEVVFQEASFTDVNFAYDDQQVLDDYTLNVKPGIIMGIQGKSGAGKSTILKLLMRFWDVDSGSVKVNGKDVREIPTELLRRTEAYVTQETQLFNTSIADNIAIGKIGATREEIEEAAKKAAIHDFIIGLPEGYDTKVGELGDTLSAGERQRIGLARAFLSGAPLLLLDEPSANLDSLNEGQILKVLKEERGDKTVVLVSHRQSTLSVADEVQVLA